MRNKLRRALPAVAIFALLAVIATFSFGCTGAGADNPTSKTPFQMLQDDVSSMRSSITSNDNDISSIRGDISQMREDLDELVASGGNPANLDEILISLASIDVMLNRTMAKMIETQNDMESIEGRLEILESGGNPGSDNLLLDQISAIPVIVNDGTYDFTVRVTNIAQKPVTGRIVLTLNAYSGSCNVRSVTTAGSPDFLAAEYSPNQAAADTVTLFSEGIVMGAASARIYQFSLTLDQAEVPFEWVGLINIAE